MSLHGDELVYNERPLPFLIDRADAPLHLYVAPVEEAQLGCADLQAKHEGNAIDLLPQSTAVQQQRPHLADLEFGLEAGPFVHSAFGESAALALEFAAADVSAACDPLDIAAT